MYDHGIDLPSLVLPDLNAQASNRKQAQNSSAARWNFHKLGGAIWMVWSVMRKTRCFSGFSSLFYCIANHPHILRILKICGDVSSIPAWLRN